ncbi:MAG TPA: NAD(P)-dependent oxidoreductase, partial [Blastocatellia bacterium]
RPMKILVTGGAGYIGSTLIPMLLASGHEVRALDNLMHDGRALLGVWSHPAFEFQRGSICSTQDVNVAMRGIDAVVHLAAIVGDPACAREPKLAGEVNRDGSLNVLAEGRHSGIQRFVFASTCSNYGKMRDPEHYVDETSELRPISLYAETKVEIEKLLLNPGQINGLCATALRFATVFGVSPRMRFDLTVNEFTLEMLTKQKLTVFGEQFWRPYIHVRDVARAIVHVLRAPEEQVCNQVFNVGSTAQNYRKQEIVDLIHSYVPQATIEYVHREEDPRDYRVSFEKIKADLNFETTRTVQDGILEVSNAIHSGIIGDFYSPAYKN